MPRPAPTPTPLILIHGDDDQEVRRRARQLFDQWCRETADPDQEIIDGAASNGSEVLFSIRRLREALNTLPFFGGTKVVWWRQCNFFGEDRVSGSQMVSQAVAELAQEFKAFVWNNVKLLISAGKVDRRKTFYKTLEKIGRVELLNSWTAETKNWQAEAENLAREHLRARQLRITEEALGDLIHQVGPNRPQLLQELEKLALYVAGNQEIGLADVEAVVVRNKQARAFALGDALGDRDLPRLLRTLDEELWGLQFDRQKSEIGLLYGLISKVRMMIFLKDLEREKRIRPSRDYGGFKAQLEHLPPDLLPEDRRFNPLAMNPYPLFRAAQQIRNYSLEELLQAMELLLECNQRLIYSNLESSLVLQQTLVQIVRGQARPAGRFSP